MDERWYTILEHRLPSKWCVVCTICAQNIVCTRNPVRKFNLYTVKIENSTKFIYNIDSIYIIINICHLNCKIYMLTQINVSMLMIYGKVMLFG